VIILKFLLAYLIVILILVVGVLVQNWWDGRRRKD
jgi:hypothetical protein